MKIDTKTVSNIVDVYKKCVVSVDLLPLDKTQVATAQLWRATTLRDTLLPNEFGKFNEFMVQMEVGQYTDRARLRLCRAQFEMLIQSCERYINVFLAEVGRTNVTYNLMRDYYAQCAKNARESMNSLLGDEKDYDDTKVYPLKITPKVHPPRTKHEHGKAHIRAHEAALKITRTAAYVALGKYVNEWSAKPANEKPIYMTGLHELLKAIETQTELLGKTGAHFNAREGNFEEHGRIVQKHLCEDSLLNDQLAQRYPWYSNIFTHTYYDDFKALQAQANVLDPDSRDLKVLVREPCHCKMI